MAIIQQDRYAWKNEFIILGAIAFVLNVIIIYLFDFSYIVSVITFQLVIGIIAIFGFFKDKARVKKIDLAIESLNRKKIEKSPEVQSNLSLSYASEPLPNYGNLEVLHKKSERKLVKKSLNHHLIEVLVYDIPNSSKRYNKALKDIMVIDDGTGSSRHYKIMVPENIYIDIDREVNDAVVHNPRMKIWRRNKNDFIEGYLFYIGASKAKHTTDLLFNYARTSSQFRRFTKRTAFEK